MGPACAAMTGRRRDDKWWQAARDLLHLAPTRSAAPAKVGARYRADVEDKATVALRSNWAPAFAGQGELLQGGWIIR